MIKQSFLIAMCFAMGSRLPAAPISTLTATSATVSWRIDELTFSLMGPSFEMTGSAPIDPLLFTFLTPGRSIEAELSGAFEFASSRLPGNQTGGLEIGGSGYEVIWGEPFAPGVNFDASVLIPTTVNPTLTLPAALVGTLGGCIPFSFSEDLQTPCKDPRDQPFPNILIDLPGEFTLTFSGPNSSGFVNLTDATFVSTSVPEPSFCLGFELAALTVATGSGGRRFLTS